MDSYFVKIVFIILYKIAFVITRIMLQQSKPKMI